MLQQPAHRHSHVSFSACAVPDRPIKKVEMFALPFRRWPAVTCLSLFAVTTQLPRRLGCFHSSAGGRSRLVRATTETFVGLAESTGFQDENWNPSRSRWDSSERTGSTGQRSVHDVKCSENQCQEAFSPKIGVLTSGITTRFNTENHFLFYVLTQSKHKQQINNKANIIQVLKRALVSESETENNQAKFTLGKTPSSPHRFCDAPTQKNE